LDGCEHPWAKKLPRYLHRLMMPTLLVWGKDDRLIPVQQSQIWRRYIPKADIQIFKVAGHLVLDEKQEAVDAVRRFLILIPNQPVTLRVNHGSASASRVPEYWLSNLTCHSIVGVRVRCYFSSCACAGTNTGETHGSSEVLLGRAGTPVDVEPVYMGRH
jgi:hypothetical protein